MFMLKQDFFRKKFSVGLCLNEPIAELVSFFEMNKDWLNSVYFSLPLGPRFYSRESLSEEYNGTEQKLFYILSVLSDLGIRREMAINTWNLTEEELYQAVAYCEQHQLGPEEIVCLKGYGPLFSKEFPNAEIKYSVNNPEPDGSGITNDFHTLVAGKGLLRDQQARHRFLDKGYCVTLLLNNGCLSTCCTACDSIKCHHYFDNSINIYGLDYTFAKCSFFPSELRALILSDRYAGRYKYKISNRPLGLHYTQQVLDAYLSLTDNYEAMMKDPRKLALFCTAHPLAANIQKVNLENVKKLKEQWMSEILYDNYRTK